MSRHVDEQKLEEVRAHATEGWYVAEIQGQQVILDKHGDPVDLVLTQQQIIDAIVAKWKADEKKRRATLREWVWVLIFVLLIYAALGALIGLIENGWGWIPALIGAGALVLIGVKGWWKP